MRVIALSTFGLLASAPGCGADVQTPFPDGLAPLEDNVAPLPQGTDAEPWPESLGTDVQTTDDHVQGHARGYIHADLDDVWAAFQDADVDVDRRRVTAWSTTALTVDGADVAYELHHTVEDLITIEYDVEWRHAAWEGEPDAPTSFVARFQKVQGSSALEVFEGSVVGIQIDDGVTEVQLIEHLSAALQGEEEVQMWLEDIYADAVAHSHGQALPVFD